MPDSASGRIDDAFRAEFVDQAVGNAKNAAIQTDILTQNDDPVILFHFLLQGQIQRLDHGHLSHCHSPLWRGDVLLSDAAGSACFRSASSCRSSSLWARR